MSSFMVVYDKCLSDGLRRAGLPGLGLEMALKIYWVDFASMLVAARY